MKKQVLFVIPHLNGGGAEKVLIDILNNFDYEKYDVDLLILFQEGIYIKDVPKNIKINYLIKKFKKINRIPWRIKKIFYIYSKIFGMKNIYNLIIKKKYDFEIAFLEGVATKFISSSWNKESKKISWVHADLLNNHWTKMFYKHLEEEMEVYKKFNTIICVSEDTKKNFIERFKIFNNIDVIYNPIDIKKIKEKAVLDMDLYVGNVFTICSVGRLVNEKGFDRLINVAKMLIEEGVVINVQIIGEGQDRIKLEKLIKETELTEFVELTGFNDNPYKYIKNCDLFVCGSRSEGFSLVVAEALILNKPIVSTRCAGPVEILNDGEFGIICENSKQGLYNSIKDLFSDEYKRKELINKSYQRESFFLIEDKMKKIYELLK